MKHSKRTQLVWLIASHRCALLSCFVSATSAHPALALPPAFLITCASCGASQHRFSLPLFIVALSLVRLCLSSAPLPPTQLRYSTDLPQLFDHICELVPSTPGSYFVSPHWLVAMSIDVSHIVRFPSRYLESSHSPSALTSTDNNDEMFFCPRDCVDFVIHYDSKAFHVHKFVLHSHSAYFRAYSQTLSGCTCSPSSNGAQPCTHPRVAHCIHLPPATANTASGEDRSDCS